MNQLLDSVVIALQAIWANKLRSFMTVLGNIVAVTSIVTVVSLIQGLNATVSDLIVSDIGADSFTIARRGIVRSEEDEERTRNNPLLTMDEAERGTRLRGQHRLRDGHRRPQRHGVVRDDGAREHPDHRGHQRVRELLQLQRRTGPDDDADRGRAQPPGRDRRLGRRRPAVRRRRTRSTRPSASPASSSASSASARRRARRSASRRTASPSSRSAPTCGCSARDSR